ncbi:unnamed protein product [Cuscuta europaea]|uniref:Protein kinase domain-containing protein n=1 Tax=Cuscuta europaea TaxID=41803 RepID=A0A9P1ECP1_CUSEU|nr:unnamed protein product [Cuscuta europaea]
MEGEGFLRAEDAYDLQETIRATTYAVMTKASYAAPPPSRIPYPVQILIVDTDKLDCVFETVGAYRLAKHCGDHKNLVGVHTTFKSSKNRNHLWIVMPSVSRVSLRSMITMTRSFRHGLPNAAAAAFLLRQTLEGLHCIHAAEGGHAHGSVCARNVYMDAECTTVKLGFGQLMCETAPCRMAPELAKDSKMVHGKAADIWDFGFFILELVYGCDEIPVSTYAGLESLLANDFYVGDAKSASPSFLRKLSLLSFGGREKKYDDEIVIKKRRSVMLESPLGDVAKQCLREDPAKRPTAKQLLEEHPYFNPTTTSNVKEIQKVLAQMKKACSCL